MKMELRNISMESLHGSLLGSTRMAAYHICGAIFTLHDWEAYIGKESQMQC